MHPVAALCTYGVTPEKTTFIDPCKEQCLAFSCGRLAWIFPTYGPSWGPDCLDTETYMDMAFDMRGWWYSCIHVLCSPT